MTCQPRSFDRFPRFAKISYTHTHPQISLLRVLLATDFARERFLAGVSDQVPLHRGDADEALAAHSADGQDFRGPLSRS